MGVDIGVCKYDKEREERIARLLTLKNLPGTEGKAYEDDLGDLINQCVKESRGIRDANIPKLSLIGARMWNLNYAIEMETISIRFDFYETFRNWKETSQFRVFPEDYIRVSNDMFRLVNCIYDQDERDRFYDRMDFYGKLSDLHYVIFPC